MAKYKPTHEKQLVLLPISLQDQLVEGTLEYTIHRLVKEHLDLSVFDARYHNDLNGGWGLSSRSLRTTVYRSG